jgi:hypothetical protein
VRQTIKLEYNSTSDSLRNDIIHEEIYKIIVYLIQKGFSFEEILILVNLEYEFINYLKSNLKIKIRVSLALLFYGYIDI